MPSDYRHDGDSEGARLLDERRLSPETLGRLRDACGDGPTPLVFCEIRWWARSAEWWAALGLTLPAFLGGSLMLACGHDVRLGHVVPIERAFSGLLLGAGLFFVLLGARSWRLRRRLGFAPGLYLFPRDLLDARGGTLKVIPTDTLEKARARDQTLELLFRGGERYTLRTVVAIPGDVEEKLKTLREQAERWEGTASADLYDPFDAERPRWPATVGTVRHDSRPHARELALLAALAVAGGAAGQAALWGWYCDHNDRAWVAHKVQQGRADELEQFAKNNRGTALAELADRAWFMSLKENKANLTSTWVWLNYLKSGGKNPEAEGLLLAALRGNNNWEEYQATLKWLGSGREELATRVVETSNISLYYLGVHGEFCEAHHREFLQKSLKIALARAASEGNLRDLFALTARQERLKGDDPYLPLLPDITSQANQALDDLQTRAEAALKGAHLPGELTEALLPALAQARQGKPLTMRVRLEGDVDPSAREGLEDTLCSVLQRGLGSFLPRPAVELLFQYGHISKAGVFHRNVCFQTGAGLTVVCSVVRRQGEQKSLGADACWLDVSAPEPPQKQPGHLAPEPPRGRPVKLSRPLLFRADPLATEGWPSDGEVEGFWAEMRRPGGP